MSEDLLPGILVAVPLCHSDAQCTCTSGASGKPASLVAHTFSEPASQPANSMCRLLQSNQQKHHMHEVETRGSDATDSAGSWRDKLSKQALWCTAKLKRASPQTAAQNEQDTRSISNKTESKFIVHG